MKRTEQTTGVKKVKGFEKVKRAVAIGCGNLYKRFIRERKSSQSLLVFKTIGNLKYFYDL